MTDNQRQWEAARIKLTLAVRQLMLQKLRLHEYSRVHSALSRQRGAARLHECVDCGGRASDWSYNNQDPDERLLFVNSTAYSLNLSNYDPRCRRCHIRFDGDAGRAQRRLAAELRVQLVELEQQLAKAQSSSCTAPLMIPAVIENAST